MFITRKFGKIFRGKATPAHLMMAAVIGAALGFMPGFTQAPGMIAALFVAALIFNSNFALIGISALLAGLVSIPMLPVSFSVGRMLMEGPFEGVFAFIINAPVLALFGFEYYATTGGLVIGTIFGVLIGIGTIRAVRGFRRRMADLEKNSEGWNRFRERRLVKLFVYVFIGGDHGKLTYEDLLNQKGTGGLFRPMGLLCVALFAVLLFMISLFTSDSIVRYALQSALERANGATVDLERAELRLREGRLTIGGLAIADPENLRTDIFRAELIEADISQADLLRKRFHIERLRAVDASTGEERRRPGMLIRPMPPPTPVEKGEGRTIEDYLRDAEKWRHRLAQVSDWLDRFSGPGKGPGESSEPDDEAARDRRLREQGYRHAVASHLVQGAPTLLISTASVEKMRAVRMPGETLDVLAENLSTQPSLVDNPPRVTVRSSSETILFDAHLAAFAREPDVNTLELVYLGLPVDSIAGGLKLGDHPPVRGGTLDFRSKGTWTTSLIDLPVEATLRNTSVSVAQSGETSVEELMLPIGVSGPLRNPRIQFTSSDFADALAAAGKAELSRRVRGEAEKLRDQAEERVGEELRDRTRGLLEGRLPGR